ncbi:transcriptional coactivator/pterin dehydratase [Gluconacetobacter diazotrophicus PA1 5]|uniref:Putative pterin-4-alpha-carbinolamine dehydratase n=2 Tax=Gluconacetobacter diazotrophicus TaxID=33996 RepID=A9HHU1_GLUDA|nr:4a-hydroxytetrahydrobiopterin dehydratase [Gluconacetobacter diazotrophicus]ACI53242.1 transcriptional coactivator/pterin dehydratase [Gluconacetobacter diazotrophicus PA1 5]MBB2156005.1 4a-hydroxytetrahydrobiopterin dehydratase [Gluconacetobacter diazotrophicus]TWB10381.1 pterin-4-alpha-carbinolamine dehydratase [Gluconacetobacter diazotrophicus]CAP55681.1 Putative pterin-4-alpha-carbinolamine dehydratase [Gluconacetobacter diazotrophicus PA1 5]
MPTSAASALAREVIGPCPRTAAPLSRAESETLLGQVPNWTLSPDGTLLLRAFVLPDFTTAYALVERIAALAEAADHHPDIAFGWGYVRLSLQSHSIGGLHRNDFIMAARIETLPH